MSFKFQIKSNASEPVMEDGKYVRYKGNVEPFRQGDQLACKVIDREKDGTPKVRYKTGLIEDDIDTYSWFTPEQKEEHRKLLKEYKPLIEKYLGTQIDETNKYIWSTPQRNKITVDNTTLSRVFDTKNIENAILYFNIMGGGFMDLVAPIKDIADNPRYEASFYILHENEAQDEIADDYGTKADAFANLRQLQKEDSGDALIYLAWSLQKNTRGFGGYTRSTPMSELLRYHGEFIEGKLTKTKRNCPKDFLEASEKWKQGGQVRLAIQVEAYLKAAEHYSYLNTNRENRYQLPSGVVIGVSIDQAVDEIRKPKNAKELEALRNFVEAKWKE